MRTFEKLADLAFLVGEEIGLSGWTPIDQARIQRFADATDDQQWIHIDPAQAAAGPFGSTIAHGFLTLSLLPKFFAESYAVNDTRMTLNYGLGKVRFPAPVPVDSRLRGRFKLLAFEPFADTAAGGAQLTVEVTVEREGSPKPVCVAESLMRQFV